MKKSSKRGFTLVEIILVILIIGIVSAITLSLVIGNYQKKALATQLSQTYSILNRGFKQLLVNYNCSDLMCTGLFPSSSGVQWHNDLNQALSKVFLPIKYCDYNSMSKCNHTFKALKATNTFNTCCNWTGNRGSFTYILQNGSQFTLHNRYCAGTASTKSSMKNWCAEGTVDVNGTKPPNIYGRDVFKIVLAQDGNVHFWARSTWALYYSGALGGTYYKTSGDAGYRCSTSVSSLGSGCGAKIQDEGWAMKY